MDDIQHASTSITRKRKAESEDDPDASTVEQSLLDPAATPRIPSEPTDHPSSSSWLLAQQTQRMFSSWQQQTTPISSPSSFVSRTSSEGPSRPKRPRIEIPQSAPPSPRRLRRGRMSYTTTMPSPRRIIRNVRASELRDTGIVSATEPNSSRVAFLRTTSLPPSPRSSQSVPVSPIEPTSPHIPSHQPPINRDTLKELDLEAILRNPQLRHDLLFDSGLQFRPTSSRRKRDMADNYWLAIVRELDTACTCVTLDAHGRLQERICICNSVPMPTVKSIRASSPSGNFMTVRTPSRLKPLLSELLEVLISIIQPVATRSSSGLCLHPGLLQPHYHQNSTHISHLRSILDADLILQQIEHNLFNPAGVFEEIGRVIRCYCAPMRDAAVDQMVKLAQSCMPGGTGTKADAVRAIRMCFEIMELMKLDVANHQLQTLRPYLIHSAAQFELKMFQESRQKGQLSLNVTRQWLRSAISDLSEQNISRVYPKLSKSTQIQIAVTKAIVNLIFDPPSSSLNHSPVSPSSSRTNQAVVPGYPETLYLDHTRMVALSTDAADFTALYMLLMLYRQLTTSCNSDGHKTAAKPDELLTLKREIWEIGPQHLGHCFTSPTWNSDNEVGSDRSERSVKSAEWTKWRDEVADVVLQLTVRAGDARSRQNIPLTSPSASSSSTDFQQLSVASRTPDPKMLQLATSWTESNLRYNSPLSNLLKKRVHKLVEETTLEMVVPSGKSPNEPGHSSTTESESSGVTSGLEPLMPEIHHLSERLAKLVSIHMNVYGALYAQPAFSSSTV
ncbi:T-complex protein 11-domain-containing protein [Abortiporus biennis]|nr:T-complex protein 11-domain-containing protein [Abortiporus biennis]